MPSVVQTVDHVVTRSITDLEIDPTDDNKKQSHRAKMKILSALPFQNYRPPRPKNEIEVTGLCDWWRYFVDRTKNCNAWQEFRPQPEVNDDMTITYDVSYVMQTEIEYDDLRYYCPNFEYIVTPVTGYGVRFSPNHQWQVYETLEAAETRIKELRDIIETW